MHILLPQFLMDGLANLILFEVCDICICRGMLCARVRDDCWHLWVGEGHRCLGHYRRMADISVGLPNILLQICHYPGELVQGAWYNIKDITL